MRSILRFELTTDKNFRDVIDSFRANGRYALNRSAWRDKPPRSCAVVGIHGSATADNPKPAKWHIEVEYRTEDCVTFAGPTKYRGWKAQLLHRRADGTLLTADEGELPSGAEPVVVGVDVYPDIEFNDLDFGTFLGESEIRGIERVSMDSLEKRIETGGAWSFGVKGCFVAPRRVRQNVKVILVSGPEHIGADGFGTVIRAVNKFAPQLERRIAEEFFALVDGCLEGKYTLSTFGNDEFYLIDLAKCFVDCTPNETGAPSIFGSIREHVPPDFLEDLATRVQHNFLVTCQIVDEGEHFGIVVNRDAQSG